MPTDQHDRLVLAIADGLKTNAGVSGIAAARIHVGEPDSPVYPCVVLTKGKAPSGIPGQLRQFGVKVESRAESADVLGPLLVAVQKAVNGFRRGEVRQCVLMDTGLRGDEAGIHSRADSFGVFAKAD